MTFRTVSALAARMQLSAGDVLDLSSESTSTLEAYGIGQKATDAYGRRCLQARRMIERGVRFVQLCMQDQPWDNHSNLKNTLRSACRRTDQPVAGGGVKPGFVYGKTDDFGHKAVENPVSVADFHATLLHLLGLDAHRLYFERNGLKERLTGFEEPRVVSEIFA